MPYQPPRYNEVDFDFIVDAYTPPVYFGVNFVFGSFATQTFKHTQQWATAVPEKVRFNLNQQWGVYVIDSVEIRLTQQWATNALSSDTFKIDQQWATVTFDSVEFALDQKWVTDALSNHTFKLNQQYAIEITGYVEWKVTQQWSAVSAADRIDLTQQWATVAVVTEKVDVTQQWATHAVGAAQHQLTQRWVTNVPADTTFHFDQTWSFYYQVGLEFDLLYGHGVSTSFDLKYDLGMSQVRQEFVVQSDITDRVSTEFVVNVPVGTVSMGFDVNYHMTQSVKMSFDITQNMVGQVREEFVLRQDIVAVDTAKTEFNVVYSILEGSTQVTTTSPVLTVNGQTVPVYEVEVSMDEGQFAWTCQTTLLDVAHYSLFKDGDSFTLDLAGEVYSFLLDSKSLSRTSPASAQASISGISPSAALSSPRATPITKTWDVATLASAVADEVVGNYGVSWGILDWSIPAFRLGVEAKVPMEILQLIAKAAGGLVETQPNGDLYVRYEFPKAVTEYLTLTPDQEYSDTDHNFTLSEQFQTQKIENKLRILDIADGAKRDRVEFVQDKEDYTRGYLKVFPSPWRETITVDHTSLPSVSATLVGVETEDLEEVVEVVEGKGNVSKPIYSIQTITWLYANLTGITFESDQTEFKTTHATNKESLVKINYKTRYVRFDVAAFPEAQVQFLVKDVT